MAYELLLYCCKDCAARASVSFPPAIRKCFRNTIVPLQLSRMAAVEGKVTPSKRFVLANSTNGQSAKKRGKYTPRHKGGYEHVEPERYCVHHGGAYICVICVISAARQKQLNRTIGPEESTSRMLDSSVDKAMSEGYEACVKRRVLTDSEDLLLLCSSSLNRSGLRLGRNSGETLHGRHSSATLYYMYLTLASALLKTKGFKRFGEAHSRLSLRRYISKLRLKYSLGSPDVLFDTIVLSSVSACPFNELQLSASAILNYILKMSALRALSTCTNGVEN